MEKFTKLKKNMDFNKNNNVGEEIGSVGNEEKSKSEVVILPYLKDDGYILLKYAKFQALTKEGIEKYHLTCIRGDFDESLSEIQNLKKILLNETSIVLSSIYETEIDGIFYKDNNGDKSKYYICLLKLAYNDYKQSSIKTTDENRVVRVSLGDIDNIRCQDLVTSYMILKLKFDENIK
jgi:hypothetical protein